jgi:hypothetical protein
MNDKAKQVMDFMDEHPEFKGRFVGWTQKDGLGISRIDDRWYQCEYYLITVEDLIEALDGKFTCPHPTMPSPTNESP